MVGTTPEHWAVRTVEVTLDPSLASLGPHAIDDIRAAFGAWLGGDPGLPKVIFDIGSTPGMPAHDGVSRVLATHDVAHGHEKDIAYTVSWASVETGIIEESDIVFNLRYAFADVAASCSGAWDIGAVAAHETGHFFGLDEDMTDKTTTMWYRTDACDAHKRALTASDIDSIETIYEPTLRATCSFSPGGTPPSGALWIAPPIVALYIRRRRRS